jgi:hypothetical protein
VRQKCDFVFFHVAYLTRTLHLNQVVVLGSPLKWK